MKVKVTENYTDLEKKELVGKGTVLEVTEERAKVLIEAKIAEPFAEEFEKTKKVIKKNKN